MTKTYLCKRCGEFDHECKIKDKELEQCKCGEKVTRVFKPIFYTECEGFCGRSYVNGR
jgi:hypothetical protein